MSRILSITGFATITAGLALGCSAGVGSNGLLEEEAWYSDSEGAAELLQREDLAEEGAVDDEQTTRLDDDEYTLAAEGESTLGTARQALTLGGTQFEDTRTQCNPLDGSGPMHCCPAGFAMSGAHLGNNVFRCTQVELRGSRKMRRRSRRGTTACPKNWVMVGYHAGRNELACQQLRGQTPLSEVVSSPPFSPPLPMHVCAIGGLMSGINAGRNHFLCAF